MPKMKSHKGSAKRMRVSASGKVRRHKGGRRHLLSHKSAKRRRRLREMDIIGGRLGRRIRDAISL